MAPVFDLTDILHADALEKLESKKLDDFYVMLKSIEKHDFVDEVKRLAAFNGTGRLESEDDDKMQAIAESAGNFLMFIRGVFTQNHETREKETLEAENARLRQEIQQLNDDGARIARTNEKRAGGRRARERSSSPFYKDEISRLEKQIGMQDDEIKSRDRQVAQLKADNAEFEAKFARVTRENQALHAEIDDLNGDIRHLNRRLDNAVTSMAELPTSTSTKQRRRATALIRRAFSTGTSSSGPSSGRSEVKSLKAADTNVILEQKLSNQERQLVQTLGDARAMSEYNEHMQTQVMELEQQLDEALDYLQTGNSEIENQQKRLQQMELQLQNTTHAQINAVQAQIQHRHSITNLTNEVTPNKADDNKTDYAAANTVVRALSNKADSLTHIVAEQQQNRRISVTEQNASPDSATPKHASHDKLYEQLQIDINNHEFDIESAAVTYFRQLLNEKDEQIGVLHNELIGASKELLNAVDLIEVMQSSLQRGNVRRSSGGDQHQRLTEQLEAQLHNAQLQLKPLEHQLTDAQNQLAVYEAASSGDLVNSIRENKALKRELKTKNQQLNTLMKRLSETEAELQILQDRENDDNALQHDVNEQAMSHSSDSAPRRPRRRSRTPSKHVSFGYKDARSKSADVMLNETSDEHDSRDSGRHDVSASRMKRSKSSTAELNSDRRNRRKNRQKSSIQRVLANPRVADTSAAGEHHSDQDKLQADLQYEIAQLEQERVQLRGIIRKFAQSSRAVNNIAEEEQVPIDIQPSYRVRAPLRQLKTKAAHTNKENETMPTAADEITLARRRNRQLSADNVMLEECLKDTLQTLRHFNTVNANNPVRQLLQEPHQQFDTTLRLPGHVKTTLTGIIGTLNEQLLACLNDMLTQRQALIEFRTHIGDLRQRLSEQIVERQVLLKRCAKAEKDGSTTRQELRHAELANKAEWQAKQTLKTEYERLLETFADKSNSDQHELRRRLVETERRLTCVLAEQHTERQQLADTHARLLMLQNENGTLKTNMVTIESQILPLIDKLNSAHSVAGGVQLLTPQPNFDADINNSNSQSASDDAEISSTTASSGQVTKNRREFGTAPNSRSGATALLMQTLEDGEILMPSAGSVAGEPGEADSGIATASSSGTNTASTLMLLAEANELRSANKIHMKAIERLKKQIAEQTQIIIKLRENLAQQTSGKRLVRSATAVTSTQTPGKNELSTVLTATSSISPPSTSRRLSVESSTSTSSSIGAEIEQQRRRSSLSTMNNEKKPAESIEKRIKSVLLSKNQTFSAVIQPTAKNQGDFATQTRGETEVEKVLPPPSVLAAFNSQLGLKQEQIEYQAGVIANLNAVLDETKQAHIEELRRFERLNAVRDAERQNELQGLKVQLLSPPQQSVNEINADVVEQQRRQIAELQDRLATHYASMEAKLVAFADLERMCDSYKRDVNALRSLIDEMRANIAQQEVRLQRERNDNEQLRHDNASMIEQIKRTERRDGDEAALQSQVKALEAELDTKARTVADLQHKLADATVVVRHDGGDAENRRDIRQQKSRSRRSTSASRNSPSLDDDLEADHVHSQRRPLSATTLAKLPPNGGRISSVTSALMRASTTNLTAAGDSLRLQALYRQTQKNDAVIEKLKQENSIAKRKLTHAESEVKKFKSMLAMSSNSPTSVTTMIAETMTTTTRNDTVVVVDEQEANQAVQQHTTEILTTTSTANHSQLQQRVRELESRLKQQEALSDQLERKRAESESREQVIRWDESKKWQSQIGKVREKLKQVQQQLEDTERRDKMSRASLERANSERAALSAELERAQKRLLLQQPSTAAATGAPNNSSVQKVNHLTGEIRRLKRDLAEQETKSKDYLKNLQDTRKLEDELKSLNNVLQKENSSLASMEDKTRQEIETLRLRCEHLQNESESAAVAGGEQSAPGNTTLNNDAGMLRQRNAELERAIGLLKPVVESLQRERNQLREQLNKQRDKLKQLEKFRVENENLHADLNKLRLAESNPEYQHSLKRVLGENDTLINELRAEKARADRLQSRVVALDSQRKLLVQRNNEMNERLRRAARAPGEAVGKEAAASAVAGSKLPRISMAYQALEKKIEELEEEVEKWKHKANMQEQQSSIRRSLAGYTDADNEDESRRVRTYEDVLNQNIRLRMQLQLVQQELIDKDRVIADLREQVKDYDPGITQNFRLLQKHHNKTIEEMTRLKVQIDVLKKDQAIMHQQFGRKGIH